MSDEKKTTLYNSINCGEQIKARFEDIGLLLSCGDLDMGYIDLFVCCLGVPFYYVFGNHDFERKEKFPEGCNLDEKIVECKGLKIAGLEGCMWYGGEHFQYTENQMVMKIKKLEMKMFFKGIRKPDILITHAPPLGIHDGKDQCHQGYKCFLDFMNRYEPRFLIHGHCHKRYNRVAERITKYKNTTVVNCSTYEVIGV